MTTMPEFLKISSKPLAAASDNDGYRVDDYKPLLGLWLIDICLTLRWIEKKSVDELQESLCDDDYIALTGLPELLRLFPSAPRPDDVVDLFRELELDDGDDVPPVRGARRTKRRLKSERQLKAAVASLLGRRRKELLAQGVRADLPLFRNVERLGRLVHLNDTEKAVLTFACALRCFHPFRAAIMPNHTEITDAEMARILSALTGHAAEEVRLALRPHSVLVTSGLVRIKHETDELESKIDLVSELRGVMLDDLASDDELGRRVLRRASSGNLTLDDFPHLAQDVQLLCAYLRGGIRHGERGINVLLYGPPGTGKTEFAKALTEHLGLTLYEISYADDEGNPIDGEQRLHSLNFCQRTLEGKNEVALLFDEIEDALPGKPVESPFGLLAGTKAPPGAKAWINRTLEENMVPTLWITNNANIDDAYLRRFDYSLALRIPPRRVRTRIAQSHLAAYAPNAGVISAIAELDDLLPAQLERAARVARLTSVNAPDSAWQYIEMTLSRSRALLGQGRTWRKARQQTGYNVDYLNTDADIPALLDGLKRCPRGTFFLYGPPGTGKTQLASHVADELGKPVLVRRASDILDKYVGEAEKRIAAMFEQAIDEDAVLILDEADSFLLDREHAVRSWEITHTNELLTRLEEFDGLFFATTNLVNRLDPACLRRFSHKIAFSYMTPDQAWRMFCEEALRHGIQYETTPGSCHERRVRKLGTLTPGDFAVALRHLTLLQENGVTAEMFVESLERETRAKQHGARPIGFQ